MNLKAVGLGVALAIGVAGGTAWAAQTIAAIVGPDGAINGCYDAKDGALRVVATGEACARRELAIRWNQRGQKGDAGPRGDPGAPGPRGEPGPSMPSLAGVPCDTGDVDKPDGQTVVTVAAANGVLTLTCKSATTNPTLELFLRPGPEVCGYAGAPICYPSRYMAREVDALGAPVAGGYGCVWTPLTLPPTCKTQRYPPGTTVRFEAYPTGGSLVPSWMGCDSVAAAVCTVTLSGDRTIAVVPAAA